ncbi:MAG: peptide deformylase [Candidatus Shikimatogenerans bostrichidophilus]|nr:MAG: peptide deformylase [Candidatus Shikimatogenerans bostrichidophilus]
MIYPILLYKNNKNILRKISTNITKNLNIKELINNMFETMNYYNGIGLSAPQIGININLFIISRNKMVFINPKILKVSKKKIESKEGCLSIPNYYANILRYKTILIEFYNEKWVKYVIKFNKLLSIIFQHEYDHLQGKLIIDYK